MRISFTIPGKPQGKARARSAARLVGSGANARAIATVYADKGSAASEAEIARLYRIQAGDRGITAGPVRINFVAVFDIPTTSFSRALEKAAVEARVPHIGRPDLDNIEKLIKDALNGVAWRDDGQVAQVNKGKRFGRPARIDVTIEHMAQLADEITPGQRKLEARVAQWGWDVVLANQDPDGRKARKSRKARSEAP